MKTSLKGRWGEAEAARYLRAKGYAVIGANYRCRYGEIDLIAEKKDILAFVEVKLRANGVFARAREFVDAHKQQRLRTTAQMWLSENPTKLQPRFDVIEIYAQDESEYKVSQINHIENAF